MRLPAPQALQALPAVAQLAVARCRSLQHSLAWRPAPPPYACPTHRAHPAPQGVLAAARQRRRVQRLAAAEEQQEQQEQQDDWNIGLAGGRQQHQRPDVHVVLVHPCIPQNAGNVARTCAATNVGLHLVGPLGFELDSKKLKRAGLDYWSSVCCAVHPSWDAFYEYWQQQPGPKQLVGYSKFAKHHFAAEGLYPPGTSTWLMFGAETTGLPPEAHAAATQLTKIPMANFQFVRSLNLATSVGIGVMEVLRQKDGAVLPEDAAAVAAAAAADAGA